MYEGVKNINQVVQDILPVVLKEHSNINLLKVNLQSRYDEETRKIVVSGKFYTEIDEEYPLWGELDLPIGVVTCISRSEGAFAIGVLKGKRVFIENIRYTLNLKSFPAIRKNLNLHKIKGGDVRAFQEAIKEFIENCDD